MSRADLRCLDGRIFRHDPVPFDPVTGDCDPDLETDIGECPECEGKGRNCYDCGREHAEEEWEQPIMRKGVPSLFMMPICQECADKRRDRYLEDHS